MESQPTARGSSSTALYKTELPLKSKPSIPRSPRNLEDPKNGTLQTYKKTIKQQNASTKSWVATAGPRPKERSKTRPELKPELESKSKPGQASVSKRRTMSRPTSKGILEWGLRLRPKLDSKRGLGSKAARQKLLLLLLRPKPKPTD
ncbi:hypothetical protein TWF281_006954 [Arthrobotrys megalospora]